MRRTRPAHLLLPLTLGVLQLACTPGTTAPDDLGGVAVPADLSGALNADLSDAASADLSDAAPGELPDAYVPTRAFYVATDGDDGHDGSSARPWRTVAHAAATMIPGDTTYVRGGLYKESFIRFAVSGTQAAPIRLLAAPGASPVIDCIDKLQFHRILLENRTPKNAMGWITIDGFEIRNCYNGIKFANANDLTIRGNWIHDNYTTGILGNGTRVVIDRNVISFNGHSEHFDHGIYMNGSDDVVTNNVIYGNNSLGVQLNGSATSLYNPQTQPGPEYAVSENWLIANNTFAYQQYGGGVVVWGSTCNNARIVNNIFYENGTAVPADSTNGVVFTSTTCTGIQIRNNLSYASGAGATAFLGAGATEGKQYVQSGNLVNVNPEFVDAGATLPASPDFALLATSPAVDQGLDLPEVTTDFLGTRRPQRAAFDIGAYELR